MMINYPNIKEYLMHVMYVSEKKQQQMLKVMFIWSPPHLIFIMFIRMLSGGSTMKLFVWLLSRETK